MWCCLLNTEYTNIRHLESFVGHLVDGLWKYVVRRSINHELWADLGSSCGAAVLLQQKWTNLQFSVPTKLVVGVGIECCKSRKLIPKHSIR